MHVTEHFKDAFTQSEKYILKHPYDQLLDPDGNEIMGSLEIPKISVNLAIYHGIGEKSLRNGRRKIKKSNRIRNKNNLF